MKSETSEVKGAFVASLSRTASEIRKERAAGIAEDAEICFRRMIEDMRTELKRLQKDRRNELDLSPSDVNTIISGKDFDAKSWAERDIKAGVQIRNLKVKIEIAEERYDFLFGDTTEEKSEPKAEVAEVS